MAHNLDITNGVASFVSAREDAWHQLGTVLPDVFTTEQALQHGHLGGWNVRLNPLETQVGGSALIIPDRFAVLRDNPIVAGRVDLLGVVGDRYQVTQNEELAGLLDNLVDESGAKFETAGALNGGKQVFITMKLPGSIRIGGVDPVDNYLAVTSGHDGNSSITMMVTPVRIVCQNTMNLAFKQASNSFRVKHTKGASRILLQQAREALDFSFNYLDGFQQQAEQLINTTLTQSQFEQIIAKEFGAPEGAPAATQTRAITKLDQMADLFSDAFTQEGVRNTAWAGLNALTEWNDHFAPVRVAPGSSESEARSRNAVVDPRFKNRALQLMTALV